ncbi:MAG TPA: hypothetical protein ENI11_03870 [Actinobacteria bacterium]|nr:hypothetical protein [Actinomycetota bacterium]
MGVALKGSILVLAVVFIGSSLAFASELGSQREQENTFAIKVIPKETADYRQDSSSEETIQPLQPEIIQDIVRENPDVVVASAAYIFPFEDKSNPGDVIVSDEEGGRSDTKKKAPSSAKDSSKSTSTNDPNPGKSADPGDNSVSQPEDPTVSKPGKPSSPGGKNPNKPTKPDVTNPKKPADSTDTSPGNGGGNDNGNGKKR